MYILFRLSASSQDVLGSLGVVSLAPEKARQLLDLMDRAAAFRAGLCRERLATGYGAVAVFTDLARFSAFAPNDQSAHNRAVLARLGSHPFLVLGDQEGNAFMDGIPPRLMDPIEGFRALLGDRDIVFEARSRQGPTVYRSVALAPDLLSEVSATGS